MSVYQRFRSALHGPRPLLSAWVGWPGVHAAATLARTEFDAVTFDMQHGAIDFAGVAAAIPHVMAADKPALVRIPVGEFAVAARLLDAGAAGVIAPMINSADDARRLVEFCKYPPLGGRSWGPGASRLASGLDDQAYLGAANGMLPLFAMIETREALAALDDILAVDGLDGVFVGPADLSIALSNGAQMNPASAQVEHALAHVLARCSAAGKLASVYAVTPARARAFVASGFAFIAIGGEGPLLRAAAGDAIAEARSKA